jgi:PTS system mannose-specific IIB component
VDNRLVHGQIIEAWLPYIGASTIIVVNDEMAADALRQEIVGLAVPTSVALHFCSIDEAQDCVVENQERDDDAIVLFSSCQDARRAYEQGLDFMILNLGNLHYAPGKRQVCANIALGKEDENCIEFFNAKGVKIDYRCVPSDPVQLRSR